jgi:hypothetical protein
MESRERSKICVFNENSFICEELLIYISVHKITQHDVHKRGKKKLYFILAATLKDEDEEKFSLPPFP